MKPLFILLSLTAFPVFAQQQQQQQYAYQQQLKEKAKQETYRELRRTKPIKFPESINVIVDLNYDTIKKLTFSRPDLLSPFGNCRQKIDQVQLSNPYPHAVFGTQRFVLKEALCDEDFHTVRTLILENIVYPERKMTVKLNGNLALVTIERSYTELGIKTESFGYYPTAEVTSYYDIHSME